MATHIVIGEVVTLRVVNAADGKEVAGHSRDLRANQKMEARIRVREVLESARFYRPIMPGDHIQVRFGKEGHTTSVFESFLTKSERIFFLTAMAENSSHFFPVFGSENLSCAEEKLGEVKTAIKSMAFPAVPDPVPR